MDTSIPTGMANIYKADKSKLTELGINTRNIRTPESITIAPIIKDGSEFNSEGNRLGFQLGDFQCSQAYRSEFNSYLAGLITIDGPKVHFSTLENAPIITTWKTEIEDGGEAKYWIVDGNTRVSIANQLNERLGDDFTATIHYTHYKGNLSGLALMYAASTLGYNSKVPVIVEDTIQALKYFKELLAKGVSVKDALATIKETFLKSKDKNPTGWSVAKLSYCSTTLALGVATGILSDSDRAYLNTEFSCVYLRYWFTKVTGQKYRAGDEVTDETIGQMKSFMAVAGVTHYAQDTGRTSDFRITSDSAWTAYTAWVGTEDVQVGQEVESEALVKPPITDERIEGLSDNLKALATVMNEVGTSEDSRVLASKVTAPLTTAIEVIAHSNPALLAAILEAASKALDTIDAKSIEGFSESKYDAALKKASKLNKDARK
jgi:hypothetical protein